MNDRKTMKLCGVGGLLLAIVTLASLLVPQSAPALADPPTAAPTPFASAVVSISLPKPSVNAGEAFDVDVVLTIDKPTRATSLELSFDASKMEVTGIEEGAFYKQWAAANGASTMVQPDLSDLSKTVDNGQGHISLFGDALMGGPTNGPTGQGTLFTLHCKAKASGPANIAVTRARVYDAAQIKELGIRMYGGTKLQAGVVTIGGGPAQAQPTAVLVTAAPQVPTAAPRATIAPRTPVPYGGDSTGDSAGFPWEIIILVLAVIVLGAVAFVVLRRRK